MERHRQSDKHHYQPTNNATIDDSRKRRHRRSPPRQEQPKPKSKQNSRSQRKEPDEQVADGALLLCENKSYVREWLARAEGDLNEYAERDRERDRQFTSENRNEAVRHDIRLQHTLNDYEEFAVPQKRKRKRHSSTDSSLLKDHIRHKPLPIQQDAQGDAALNNQYAFIYSPRITRHNQSQSEIETSSNSSASIHLKETFERQKRHKTREDRYQIKNKDNGGSKKHKKPRAKREKRGDRKRAVEKAGEELMQNFSSKNIGQDRLTVEIRPASGLGLFTKGRASSPAKRRGLPDLAFSEMEFLQHQPSQQPVENDNRGKSRWREKERRKSTRARQEVFEFFKPPRLPLQEYVVNQQAREPSIYSQNEGQPYNKQDAQQEDLTIHRPSLSIEAPSKSSIAYQKPRSSSDRPATSRGETPLRDYASRFQHTQSRGSGRATSYASWSETEGSPVTKLTRARNFHTGSVTNELEDSRSLRGMGIEKKPTLGNARPMHQNERNKSLVQTTESTKSTTTSPSKPSELYNNQQRHQHEKQNRESISDHSPTGNRLTAQDEELIPRYRYDQDGERAPKSRKRTIVEYFDPVYGWQEKPAAEEVADRALVSVPKIAVPEEVKSTSVDRQEIAKYARIKRPSTTLSVARAEDGMSSASHKQTLHEYSRALDAASTTQTKPVDVAEQVQANYLLRSQPNKDGSPIELESQNALINAAGDSGQSSKPALPPRGQNEHTAHSQSVNLEVDTGKEVYPKSQDSIRFGLPTMKPIRMISQPSWSASRVEPPPIFVGQLQREPTTFNYSNHEELRTLATRREESLYPHLEVSYADGGAYVDLEEGGKPIDVDDSIYTDQMVSAAYGERAMMEHGYYVEDNGAWQPEVYRLYEDQTNVEYYDEQVPGIHDGDIVQGVSYDHIETHAPREQHYDNELYDIEEEDVQLEGFWRAHQQYH